MLTRVFRLGGRHAAMVAFVVASAMGCAKSPARNTKHAEATGPTAQTESAGQPDMNSQMVSADRTCEKDDDCTLSHHGVEPDGKCCASRCPGEPVSKSWQSTVQNFCDKIGYSDECSKSKCDTQAPVQCRNGQCEATQSGGRTE